LNRPQCTALEVLEHLDVEEPLASGLPVFADYKVETKAATPASPFQTRQKDHRVDAQMALRHLAQKIRDRDFKGFPFGADAILPDSIITSLSFYIFCLLNDISTHLVTSKWTFLPRYGSEVLAALQPIDRMHNEKKRLDTEAKAHAAERKRLEKVRKRQADKEARKKQKQAEQQQRIETAERDQGQSTTAAAHTTD
jgi:hypothetical protein